MASTYGNDLRLEEIGDGEQSGTWGATTNTNLELIAEALSFGTEAITTNADTHTTTIADGATDPGRSLYLKYTGTLDSTCTITIAPNSISKTWYIENGTSGSQSIIISQGSGANVTIPTGQTKIVYSDGAGSGAAMAEIGTLGVTNLAVTTNATVGGTLGVTGVLTGTSLDISGNVDIDGTLETDALSINSTAVTSTATELNILDGVTATTAELNIMDGVTATTAELNIMDGVTSTTTEINQLDAITRGSILYGNASGATARLAKGGADTVLTSDGTDISWAAAGGGGGEATFTATGAITAGNPVGFNANGTISAMPQTAGSAAALGSGASSTDGGLVPMAYDTANDKYLHVFSGTNDNLFARVGTVSGFSISFGTAVDSGITLSSNVWRGCLHLVYDDNAGKFVVSYSKTDNKGYARTITISGTTPSFGTEVNVYSYTTYHTEVGYDSNANKVLFLNAGNQSALTGRVGTISGTNISLGSSTSLGGTGLYAQPGSLAFDSNVNKFIFVYAISSGSTYYARTISISGTSVSAGAQVILASSGDSNVTPNVVFDPSINKGVALFSESDGPKFRLLTISGTDLTQGTTTAIPLTTTPVAGMGQTIFSSCVDPDTAGIVICYCTGVAETRITPAKFSGSTMTLSPEIVVSSTKKQGGIIYDPDADATIVSTIDEDQVVKTSARPAYVGVAAESISNGATGKVTIIGGVNANQSGLSAGSQYGIPATSASLAATDTNPVGIAISSTEVYLRAALLQDKCYDE